MQKTPWSCLPASAVMLLHQEDLDHVSEGELAYLANTTFFGTESHAIARAINQKVNPLGMTAEECFTNYDDCMDEGKPFIAFLQMGFLNHHTVLVKKMQKHSVILVDPLERVSNTLRREVFEEMWNGRVIWITRKR